MAFSTLHCTGVFATATNLSTLMCAPCISRVSTKELELARGAILGYYSS